MSTRFFLAVLSAWLGAGCASMREPIQVIDTVDEDYRFPGRPGHGLLIASTRFSHDCQGGSGPSASLAYINDWDSLDRWGLIPLTGPSSERDFQDPPGYLVVRELKAGEHRFRYLHINSAKQGSKDMRIPFTAEEGKAIYLGEIHMRYINCDGWPSVTLEVKDEWERDAQLFRKQLKNLRSEDVIKRVLPASLIPWR
jgi:hypothetical protein